MTSANWSHDAKFLLTSSDDKSANVWMLGSCDSIMTFSTTNQNLVSNSGEKKQVSLSIVGEMFLSFPAVMHFNYSIVSYLENLHNFLKSHALSEIIIQESFGFCEKSFEVIDEIHANLCESLSLQTFFF